MSLRTIHPRTARINRSDKAQRILDAMNRTHSEGRGAVSLNGKMIDLASVRQAENLLNKADAISAKAG